MNRTIKRVPASERKPAAVRAEGGKLTVAEQLAALEELRRIHNSQHAALTRQREVEHAAFNAKVDRLREAIKTSGN